MSPLAGSPDSRHAPCGPVAVVFVYLGLGILWTALIPVFEKPDEIHHFAYVQFMSEEWRIPTQGKETFPFLEPETQQPPLYYVFGALLYRASLLSGVPETDLHVWEKRVIPPPKPGREFFLHPDRFLDSPGLFSYDVLLVRLFSLGLGALALVCIYKTAAQVLQPSFWLPVLSGALVATLPQFTFITTSVSNDVMGFALGSLFIYRLVTVDSAHLSRDYLVLGVLMGLAVLVKATVLPLLPLVLLPVLRRDVTPKERVSALGVFAAAFAALGGWWLLRNVQLYGDFLGRQEVINPQNYAWNIDRKSLSSPYFRDFFWRRLGQSFVGRFGFMNIGMPRLFYQVSCVLLVVSIAGLLTKGLRSVSRHRHRLREWASAQPVLLAGSVLLGLAALVQYNLTVSQPQGRYLFHVLAAIVCLFMMGLLELARPLKNHLPAFLMTPRARGAAATAVVGALVGLNLYALFRVVLTNY